MLFLKSLSFVIDTVHVNNNCLNGPKFLQTTSSRLEIFFLIVNSLFAKINMEKLKLNGFTLQQSQYLGLLEN